MIWLRRLPGVGFLYRYRAFVALCATGVLLFVFSHSRDSCTDTQILSTIEQLCDDYAGGLVLGSFCETLCSRDPPPTIGCSPHHNGKLFVFSAAWKDQNVFLKSAYPMGQKESALTEQPLPPMSEEKFRSAVAHLVNVKVNISISSGQLDRLVRLTPRAMTKISENRHLEMQQVFTLLQSQEYLLSVLFSDQDVFPYVYGTCGYLYAVESLTPPEVDGYFFDEQKTWAGRLKLAVQIMDFLEQLETEFIDPLRTCDVKMSHFGLTPLGKLKFLDLTYVHTESIVQKLTAGGNSCQSDDDCDLMDCKGSCNPRNRRCDLGVSNNNLQVVCEKIFLGHRMMNGKLLVPGLLMTEFTPVSLASLLRQCADTGRGAVPEDIRQRLYTTLTEMEQFVSERVL